MFCLNIRRVKRLTDGEITRVATPDAEKKKKQVQQMKQRDGNKLAGRWNLAEKIVNDLPNNLLRIL